MIGFSPDTDAMVECAVSPTVNTTKKIIAFSPHTDATFLTATLLKKPGLELLVGGTGSKWVDLYEEVILDENHRGKIEDESDSE